MRSSQTFAGNVAEAGTLVVSRERTRHFNPEQAIDIETATDDTVRGQ